MPKPKEVVRIKPETEKARKSYVKVVIGFVGIFLLIFLGIIIYIDVNDSKLSYESCVAVNESLKSDGNYPLPVSPCIKPGTLTKFSIGIMAIICLFLVGAWYESTYVDNVLWHAQINNRTSWYGIIYALGPIGAYLYKKRYNLVFKR